MGRSRRQLLLGGALAAAATTGCLESENADDSGRREPTTAVTEEPHVDEPPYDISEPPADADEWNELYLCENMPAETDLEFQTVSAPRLTAPLLPSADHSSDEYAVRLLTSAEAVQEVFETGVEGTETETQTAESEQSDGSEGSEEFGDSGDSGSADDVDDSEEPLAETDFEANVLLVVESAYVPGSLTHHWERVEVADRGFQLHGCYAVPFERSGEATTRHSVVRVERPDSLEFARVSLTGEDERVHFNSTEGVVVQRDV